MPFCGRVSAQPRQDALNREIQSILSSTCLKEAEVGLHVIALPSKEPLFSHSSDRPLIAASNTKLFTTAAALVYLGSDYRFKTTVYCRGDLSEGGRLSGDIVVKGGGDPNISGRFYGGRSTAVLEQWARLIAEAGIKEIEGDVVADDTFFDREYIHPGWPRNQLSSWYCAPVSGLSFNDNCVELSIIVGRGEMKVQLEPNTGYVKVYNSSRIDSSKKHPRLYAYRKVGPNPVVSPSTVSLRAEGEVTPKAAARGAPVGCSKARPRRDSPPANNLSPLHSEIATSAPGRTRNDPPKAGEASGPNSRANLEVFIKGEVSSGPAPRIYFVPVDNPPLFLASVFKEVLEAEGIRVGGSARVIEEKDEALPLRELVCTTSTMAQSVKVTNTRSQNFYAEQILKTLGAEKKGQGSFRVGVEVVKELLTELGYAPEGYQIVDGSGLSKDTRLSPAMITELLAYMYQHKEGETFLSSLPVSGTSGSLKKRLTREPYKGRVRAKTGYLSKVSALSGYVETLSGETLAFSILINDFKSTPGEIKGLQDALCKALVGY